MLLIMFILFRSFFQKGRNAPFELFTEALRNENSGHFEKAILNYETALGIVNKTRFHSTSLKSKIVEKLKILHTVTEYHNNFQFRRRAGNLTNYR